MIGLPWMGPGWIAAADNHAPPEIDTPELTQLQADVIFTPPANSVIHDVAFSPDGQSVFVLMSDRAVNLWGLLLFYWPEWTCLILGVVLWSVGRMWWNRYTRRISGPENDASTDSPDEQQESSAHASGHRRHIPLFIHALIIVTAVGTYVLRALIQPPRVGSAVNWIQWDSEALADWAIENDQEWLAGNLDVMEPVMYLDEIEFSTGKLRGQRYTWRRLTDQDTDSEWRWHRLGKHSIWKGGALQFLVESDDLPILAFYESGQLQLFDCRSHQVVKTHRVRVTSWCRLKDTDTAYGLDGDCKMRQIDLKTGDISIVSYNLKHTARLDYDNQVIVVTQIEQNGKQMGPANVIGHPFPNLLATNADGRFVYAKVNDPKLQQGVLVWDTAAERWIARLSALNGRSYRMVPRNDGAGLLVLSGIGTSLKLFDLSTKINPVDQNQPGGAPSSPPVRID